ncbi:hypothetical protein ABPG74_010509 [Tetrahymena malaccensis]
MALPTLCNQCGITRGATFATIRLLVFNKPTSQIFYQPENIHTTSFTTVALVGGPSVIAVHYMRTKALFINYIQILIPSYHVKNYQTDTFQFENKTVSFRQ